jgi:hypothetical protein
LHHQVIEFERFPHVKEIIQFVEIGYVEPLEAHNRVALLQKINDLRLARCGPARKNQNGEMVVHGSPFAT